MRKVLLLIMLLALLVPLTIAQDEDMEDWTCPEGYEGQSLSVYNWSTYIAEDTMPNFEEACGVDHTYDIFDSGETMLARIRQGNPGYDIIVPSDNDVAVMIREELLIPLDHDLIPNMANIIPSFADPSYDPGNVYSIPYQWGTIGIAYNKEIFPDGITSWQQVWDHEGPVAWLDDRRAMFGIALTILGYDPNTEDADEIAEAKDFLIERGGNVVVIAADDGQEWLGRGDVDIAVEYSGDIFGTLLPECECDTYDYVIPEEGTNLWTDNLAIPIDAPNPELAMVFIDYILDAQVGADLSNYIGYGSPNQASIDAGLIDEEMLENLGIYPAPETYERLFVISEPSPEAEQLYNDAWDELLIFVGS